MEKLRVWWIPQVGSGCPSFYKEVNTVEEGVLLMDTLAFYDIFQFKNNIKPDYSNAGGLERYNEDDNEWEDWYHESQQFGYFDDPEDFLTYKKEAALESTIPTD